MELEKIIKKATLIDVRAKLELLLEGKIETAHNIPMQTIPIHLDKIKRMQKPIVVFCKSGGRASQVIDFLVANNVSEVYNGGGYQDVKALLLL